MAQIALVVRNAFHAWGHTYNAGAVVPEAHWRGWPAGTLANRLAGGDVEWDEPPAVPVAVIDEDLSTLRTMDELQAGADAKAADAAALAGKTAARAGK